MYADYNDYLLTVYPTGNIYLSLWNVSRSDLILPRLTTVSTPICWGNLGFPSGFRVMGCTRRVFNTIWLALDLLGGADATVVILCDMGTGSICSGGCGCGCIGCNGCMWCNWCAENNGLDVLISGIMRLVGLAVCFRWMAVILNEKFRMIIHKEYNRMIYNE